jgi:hypothetical protein
MPFFTVFHHASESGAWLMKSKRAAGSACTHALPAVRLNAATVMQSIRLSGVFMFVS